MFKWREKKLHPNLMTEYSPKQYKEPGILSTKNPVVEKTSTIDPLNKNN